MGKEDPLIRQIRDMGLMIGEEGKAGKGGRAKRGKWKAEWGKWKEGKRLSLFPSSFFPLSPSAYAGAGLPPVIGGRIGFSGLVEGSFNCGRS